MVPDFYQLIIYSFVDTLLAAGRLMETSRLSLIMIYVGRSCCGYDRDTSPTIPTTIGFQFSSIISQFHHNWSSDLARQSTPEILRRETTSILSEILFDNDDNDDNDEEKDFEDVGNGGDGGGGDIILKGGQ